MIMKNQLRKGVVLIDKPRGMTSFDVVERVGRILGVEKAGHTGTLDMNVTGLLVIALGESRKAMPVLMGMDKGYEGKMLLHRNVVEKTIGKTFKSFTGEIVQKPPVKSRVARVERKREIHSLKILKINGREISFEVKCEAGTYIRKLVHDMGEHAGSGAHMKELRRTSVGPFSLKESVPLSKVSEKDVIPLEKVLDRTHLKKITVNEEAVPKIRNGSPVFPEWVIKKDKAKDNETIGIFDKAGEIIALGKFSNKGIKTDRVFNLPE